MPKATMTSLYPCGCYQVGAEADDVCPVHCCAKKAIHVEPSTQEQREQVYELARRLAFGMTWVPEDER